MDADTPKLVVTPEDREMFKMVVTNMVGPMKHNAIDGGGFDQDERMQYIASARIASEQAAARRALEMAAEVADGYHVGLRGIGPVGRSSVNTARHLADAIRAIDLSEGTEP